MPIENGGGRVVWAARLGLLYLLKTVAGAWFGPRAWAEKWRINSLPRQVEPAPRNLELGPGGCIIKNPRWVAGVRTGKVFIF